VRSLRDILGLGITIVAAIVIGFGVPLLWVWIGSQLQGGSGATSLSFSVAIAILLGIIATYVAVLYMAGWVMGRTHPQLRERRQRGTARQPWMRGMTDTRQLQRAHQQHMAGLERVFVTTTIIVSIAFTVWLLFIAGSPLPNP
jgi:multisubunit Na+/H+ antiporter MnhC subunit